MRGYHYLSSEVNGHTLPWQSTVHVADRWPVAAVAAAVVHPGVA